MGQPFWGSQVGSYSTSTDEYEYETSRWQRIITKRFEVSVTTRINLSRADWLSFLKRLHIQTLAVSSAERNRYFYPSLLCVTRLERGSLISVTCEILDGQNWDEWVFCVFPIHILPFIWLLFCQFRALNRLWSWRINALNWHAERQPVRKVQYKLEQKL
jgi:hypothetical protein